MTKRVTHYSVASWCCSVITACHLRPRANTEGKIDFTDVEAAVTCKRCLKTLEEWAKLEVTDVALDETTDAILRSLGVK